MHGCMRTIFQRDVARHLTNRCRAEADIKRKFTVSEGYTVFSFSLTFPLQTGFKRDNNTVWTHEIVLILFNRKGLKLQDIDQKSEISR